SPCLNFSSLSTPSTGEGTSSTTLSVSRSSRFSSRRTVSPAFLCQVAMMASDTDSGSTGTLTSMLMDVVLLDIFGGVVRLFDNALFGDVVAVGRIDQRVGKECGLFFHVRRQVPAGRRRGAGT